MIVVAAVAAVGVWAFVRTWQKVALPAPEELEPPEPAPDLMRSRRPTSLELVRSRPAA